MAKPGIIKHVHFRMAEDPEEVLPQNGRAARLGIEKA